jgi:hypothetical protein
VIPFLANMVKTTLVLDQKEFLGDGEHARRFEIFCYFGGAIF